MYTIFDLPKIPKHLILSIEEVLKLDNKFTGLSNNYSTHNVQNELKEYLQLMFPEHQFFRYQLLKGNIPIHVDVSRDIAINYIIDTGGSNVSTVWYDDTRTTAIESVVFQPNIWHSIRTDIPHNVNNITEQRFAITITKGEDKKLLNKSDREREEYNKLINTSNKNGD